MQMPICSRCKKNIAVVFLTRIENGRPTNEGICLKCAKELGIKPVNDMMEKMGITEEDLDGLTNEMLGAFGNEEGLIEFPQEEADGPADSIESNTATVPFINKIFGPAGTGGATPFSFPPQKEQEKKGEPKKEVKRKFLESYAQSLTQKAVEGRLDRVVGRGEEIERVIQILNRRQKNNPCLIGEPGVGKTAVAEGLAQRIADKSVPYKLMGKEVWLLDLTALVAGTQFRGQFESRMKGLIDEVKRLKNIILVIDEVHNLVGTGDAEGSMNAANILKPALSRGDVQVIGATTFVEYRKHIEKDSALERRFQPVTINEPSIGDTVQILEGVKKYYEDFHGVSIDSEMSRQAVLMSERYITDRYLPDKAIDLMDEACSALNLKSRQAAETERIEGELTGIHTERELLLQDNEGVQNYERLAMLKSREIKLQKMRETLMAEGRPKLTTDDLARVIELWTHIPASKVQEKEFERLSRLEERLKTRVIGQEEAIASVSAAIRRSRAGISPKHKPVSFIFVGPTGVGKTELVKCLAADLFDSQESLIRLDMSEFMEKHSVSRIIGSPPGYVGYDEAGQLTEKIRRKPYSVILFDEIEKAHPDVLNILLQILDDGRISDAHGRVVSFENTVIIMTSNAGSDKKDGTVGFGRSVSEQGKEKALKALSDIMRPEFINRIDEVISFNQLTEGDFEKITRIMLFDLETSLKDKNIRLSYDDSLVSYLVKKSYSVKYGARNLRRLIQKEVEDPAAQLIISNYERPLAGIHLSSDGEKVLFSSV